MKQLIIIPFILFAMNLFAQSVETPNVPQKAIVRSIHDGDSYGVRFFSRPDTTIMVRLHNVDAPEVIFYVTKDQPYARKSAENMRKFLLRDTVEITVVYKDAFKRLVCDIVKDSTDLSSYVISHGYGWFSNDDATTLDRAAELKELQNTADKANLGLWGEPGRKLRPETWRKRYSRLKDGQSSL